MKMLDDDMLNAWCVYWAPDDHDDYGKPKLGDPVATRCNWANSDTETLMIDGVAHSVAHSVYVPIPVAAGGYLWLVPRGSMAKTADAAAVLAVAPATAPRDGRILAVNDGADLDDETDVVYRALL